MSDAIIFTPSAREGFAPFIGPRAGEVHENAVISGNIIQNFQQTAVYSSGRYVIIADNVFDTIVPSGGSAPPAAVALLNGETTVSGNTFKSIPNYAVAATGPYTNIVVSGNNFIHGNVTNFSGIFVFQSVTDLTFENNYARLSPTNAATFLYLDRCTNVFAINNTLRPSVGAVPIGLANVETQTEYRSFNNSWERGEYRWSYNGLADLETVNLSTNILAGAGMRVITTSGGGGIYAYPTNYAGVANAGRVVIANDSTAAGINFDIYKSSDDLRLNINQQNRAYWSEPSMWFRGTAPIPFVLDSDNVTATYMLFRSAAVDKVYIGYSAAYGGLVAIDSTGALVNLSLSDAGDMTVRGDIAGVDGTFSGTLSASLLQLTSLNTGTLTTTNGVIMRTAADGPAAATIGAGNAAMWLSNSIYLYLRTTADGISATDTLVSP